MVKHLAPLAGGVMLAVFSWGCAGGGGSSVTEICPAVGEGNVALKTIAASNGKVRMSAPPEMVARAHGQSAQLVPGMSEWCGAVFDVFPPRVVTSDTPLVVSADETVEVANPLSGEHLFGAGVGFVAVRAEPTLEAGRLVWPSGPGGADSLSHAEHNVRFDDDGITFVAGEGPGRYVVDVRVEYARVRADSPKRHATYTLLIEVKE